MDKELKETTLDLLEEAYNVGYSRGYEASPYAPDEFENPTFDEWLQEKQSK